MEWERRLAALFDDLEQRAEGMALADRDADVADQARSEYAEVLLVDRLHASVGRPVSLDARGWGTLRGTLRAVGSDWCLLDGAGPEGGRAGRVVSLAAVTSYRGLVAGALPGAARPVTSRLGLGALLRRSAEAGDDVVLVRVDGTRLAGRVLRVGRDFVELAVGGPGAGGAVLVVPFAAVAVLDAPGQ
jgi:hypothetical protein